MIQHIEKILRKHWGYDSFMPLQKKAIECVVEGRDSIVVLPTGGGKSLCFQAPSVAMHGLAVVVSPLISLMKDQVDALRECGIPAAYFNSSLSQGEQNAVLDRIRKKTLKLLYLAPERLVSDQFIELLSKTGLSYIAVDEAHCISIWGHNFRPEYRQLGRLKKTFTGAAIHAYTATATKQVQSDIARQLNLKNPDVLIGSFYRPNLIYKVERRTNTMKQICSVLDRHKNESGIIYCIRRADVDDMCDSLKILGYRVAPYHAGMEDVDRKKNHELFIGEKVDTIVATVAFGMGIDKSNVRYVIHAAMPQSLEYYQQESGRAGRDRLEAECCLFYSGKDFMVWKYILSDKDKELEKIAFAKLSSMYNYCTGVECRHKVILNYFSQRLDNDNCNACDVCLGSLEYFEDSLETAQKILSCIKRLGERFGADYTSLILIGSRDERVLDNGHDSLSTYGILSANTKNIVRNWVEQLVMQGCIEKSADYNVLKVTEKGWKVLKGEETPRLLKPAVKQARLSKTTKDSWDGVDKGLFDELRELRRRIAEKNRVPAYLVFGDAALRDMARRKPTTTEAFLEVNGVGEQKCKQYSTAFLKAVREYLSANSIKANVGKQTLKKGN